MKENKKIILLILTICVVILISIALIGKHFSSMLSGYKIGSITIGGFEADLNHTNITVNVYLATTLSEQTKGLMNQKTLGDCNGYGNCYGMLFIFPYLSNTCFWMEDTPMQLKQFWITNNTITSIENATPYSNTTYCHAGNEVLETATNSSLVIGDKVYLESGK